MILMKNRICTKVLLLLLILNVCGCAYAAAPIVLPDVEDIISISIESGDNTENHKDLSWIEEAVSAILSSEPTSKQSVQDTPQVDSYVRIDIQLRNGTSTIFAYEQDGKFYVEQPYQGIYEIEAETFELLVGEQLGGTT